MVGTEILNFFKVNSETPVPATSVFALGFRMVSDQFTFLVPRLSDMVNTGRTTTSGSIASCE